jgi:hypothetical protein
MLNPTGHGIAQTPAAVQGDGDTRGPYDLDLLDQLGNKLVFFFSSFHFIKFHMFSKGFRLGLMPGLLD